MFKDKNKCEEICSNVHITEMEKKNLHLLSAQILLGKVLKEYLYHIWSFTTIIMNAYSSVPWVQGLKNIMNRIVPTEPTTFNKLLCISKPIKPPSCVKKITEYRDFTVGKN